MDLNPVAFAQVTNRESWSQLLGLDDEDTGEPLDLTSLTFTCEVRRERTSGNWSNTYSTNYSDVGTDDFSGPIITLSLGSGLTVIDTGKLQVSFTLEQMRTLYPDTYSIALICSNGVDTRQIFLGTLPVLFGGVS